jgi:predicted deacylase
MASKQFVISRTREITRRFKALSCDSNLNRSFPGSSGGTATQRIAYSIYEIFVRHCDLRIDIHTSTRGQTNLVHVR